MKALKTVLGILAAVGLFGMLCTNEDSEYWWVTLLCSFALFLISCLFIAFIENRFFVYASLYASIAVIGAKMCPIMNTREFPVFCRKLLAKCNGNYRKLYRIVKKRYLIHQKQKGVIE